VNTATMLLEFAACWSDMNAPWVWLLWSERRPTDRAV